MNTDTEISWLRRNERLLMQERQERFERERQQADKEAADKAAAENAARQARDELVRTALEQAEAASVSAVSVRQTHRLIDPHKPLLPERERRIWVQRVTRLALEPPVIRIAWTIPRTASARLIGENNGTSFTGAQSIATRAITTLSDALCGLHEIGHQRTSEPRYRIDAEVEAWLFCIRHSLYWDADCHHEMARCLGTYVSAAEHKRDVFDVQRAEALISDDGFGQHERPYSPAIFDRIEDDAFIAAHGQRLCEGAPCVSRGAVATATDAGRFVCRACYVQRTNDRAIKIHKLTRQPSRGAAHKGASMPAVHQSEYASLTTGPNPLTPAIKEALSAVRTGHQTCSRCRFKPATGVTTNNGVPRALCGDCRDREQLHDQREALRARA